MSKQKTAVQTIEEFLNTHCNPSVCNIEWGDFKTAIIEAKAMEKEQIENAYWEGGQDLPLTEKRCEEYYEKTFEQ